MSKAFRCMMVFLLLLALLTGCGKDETITFSAEIEEVSGNSILVKTIDYGGFDRASVDLKKANYDFDPEVGQLVEVTIQPEIRESYPVQVTGVKLVLKGEAEKKVADYFPIKENVKYVYEGKGNEFAGYDVYVEYTSKDRVQQRIENGATVSARVYEVKNGKLSMLLSKGETYYREDLLEQSADSEDVLLMEPLKKGTSWAAADGSQRTITGTAETVDTPTGTYSCIEVITESGEGTTIDYYARGIGLVKTIFQSGGMEISSTLKSIENDVSRTEKIRFYYPDIEKDKIFYQEKDVTFRTNDSTAKIMEGAYRDVTANTYGTVLPTGAAIKSLTLDEKNRVRVDFNAAFAENMNAGIEYETMILQSVADTFGHYYQSEEVILTVEGKPYQSGHVSMEQDESIPVKLEEPAQES